jgi:hypothetical protein
VFLTGFLYYVTTVGLADDWDLNYTWPVFSRKLTGEAFAADHNHFGTNFIGHPLGGAGYYLAARSNRLGIYQSFGFSVAGSMVWEYFGEITEVVSMNDTLVTPLAGWAIGESMFQLGAFFDRSGPELHNRVLGAVFAPLKTFNDWYDDAEPLRPLRGFPENEWHRFDLGVGLFVVEQGAGSTSGQFVEGRFRLSERLARLPNFDRAGRHGLAFGEANVSGIELEGAIGDTGLTDLRLSTQVVLAGYYHRQAHAERSLVWGGGGLVGVGVGFEYAVHDLERDRGGPADRISSIQPLVLVLEHRLNLGELKLHSYVDVGPNFGGIRALALERFTGDREVLPEVLKRHGYYFGLGGHGSAALGATWRRVEAGGRLRAEGYRAIDSFGEPMRHPIADTHGVFSAHLGYRLPDSPTVIRTTVERRVRGSSVGGSHVFRTETSAGLGVAAVF